MNTAKHLQTRNIPIRPESIVSVVFDGKDCIVHTEATLDTWWANLSAEHKAKIYEADLEGMISEPQQLPSIDDIEREFYGSISEGIALLHAESVQLITEVHP